jgi:hypothetical protein
MEAENVDGAPKRQVSEKVLANLAKAQARRKELYEQRKAEKAADKETTKKQKKVERLKKQLVELVGRDSGNESREEEQSDGTEPQESSEPIEEMPEPVVVKKVKAPPPVEKVVQRVAVQPKPVRERVPPPPPPAQRPRIDFC